MTRPTYCYCRSGARHTWAPDCERPKGAGGPVFPPPVQSTPDPLPHDTQQPAPRPADPRGLHRKFEVTRTDGRSAPGTKHHGCRYLVLDLDHDPDAPAAVRAYIDAIRATRPSLAADLTRALDA